MITATPNRHACISTQPQTSDPDATLIQSRLDSDAGAWRVAVAFAATMERLRSRSESSVGATDECLTLLQQIKPTADLRGDIYI